MSDLSLWLVLRGFIGAPQNPQYGVSSPFLPSSGSVDHPVSSSLHWASPGLDSLRDLLPTTIWAPAVLLPALRSLRPPLGFCAPQEICSCHFHELLTSRDSGMFPLPTWSLRLVVSIRLPAALQFLSGMSSPPISRAALLTVCAGLHHSCFTLTFPLLSTSHLCCASPPLLPSWRSCCITFSTIFFGQNFQSLSHCFFFLIHF